MYIINNLILAEQMFLQVCPIWSRTGTEEVHHLMFQKELTQAVRQFAKL